MEAVRVGDGIVMALHRRAVKEKYRHQLVKKAYTINETPHFLVCRHPRASHMVLMHTFGQAEMNADLICFVEQELSDFPQSKKYMTKRYISHIIGCGEISSSL